MLIWTPDNASTWFMRPESDVDFVELISISSDDDIVDTVTYSFPDGTFIPDGVSITATSGGVAFSATSLSGLFPIVGIKYLNAGVLGECFDFSDIPSSAEDVLEYKKDASGQKSFFMTVTATESNTSPTTSGTEVKIYEFIIEADYSPGRDALLEAVNARR
jgi:hypothetical protein